MAIEEVEFSLIWEKNGDRTWVKHLMQCYETRGAGDWKNRSDFETIAYWILEFALGRDTTLVVDQDYIVTDGHHRLIAAKLSGVETIKVNVCPQRTTYR